MTRVEFGLLGSYNKYKKSPFETYYMGGDGMSGYSTGYAEETVGLRGYENGSLTPYGAEGYAYSRMSLELRYPFLLGNTTIYGLGFVEAGNAWTENKQVQSIRHEAFCWSWRSYLPPNGGYDGYRLGLWLRQSLWYKGRKSIPLHPWTGVLRAS